MTEPSLAELLDGPTFTVRVGGRDYGFSEVPVSSLLAMEEWIRANTPHPIESIKPHLAGLEPAERQQLLERARQDALEWPPRIGTSAGAAALLGSGDMGQIETLYHGLLVHHPGATRDHARGLYRKLKQAMKREIADSIAATKQASAEADKAEADAEASPGDVEKAERACKAREKAEVVRAMDGESTTVKRIFAAIFGMLDEQGEPQVGLPKGEQTARNGASDGISSFAAASNA
jgi:hypothetical protein